MVSATCWQHCGIVQFIILCKEIFVLMAEKTNLYVVQKQIKFAAINVEELK
jgi:hypothetical protein